MIFDFLSTSDLARCVLVNKDWCRAAIPHLWCNTPSAHNWAFYKMVLEAYQHSRQQQSHCLSEHGRYIKKLINPQDLFDYCRTSHNSTKSPSQPELLCYFLKYCTGVSELELKIRRVRSYRFLNQFNNIAPMLRVLHLSSTSDAFSQRILLDFLARCSSKLESLTILNVIPLECHDADDYKINLPGLKDLKLMICRGKKDMASWIWLQCCKNVEKLELSLLDEAMMCELAAGINAYFPNLNSLVLNLFGGGVFHRLLSACTGLKNIQFKMSCAPDQLLHVALKNHCSTLETIRLSYLGESPSAIVRHILSTSPNLQTLITGEDDCRMYFKKPYLEAKDFIDLLPDSNTLKPWRCEKHLKVFKTKIICIPRPDVTKYYEAEFLSLYAGHASRDDALPEIFPGEGRLLQQRVYERLGKFINLEELSLGQPDIMGENYQYECLEMTLESGLTNLHGLKKLQVLDVQGMAQRIGVQEVRWMTEHWSRLRVICGLWNHGVNKEAVDWLRFSHPWIKIEPYEGVVGRKVLERMDQEMTRRRSNLH